MNIHTAQPFWTWLLRKWISLNWIIRIPLGLVAIAIIAGLLYVISEIPILEKLKELWPTTTPFVQIIVLLVMIAASIFLVTSSIVQQGLSTELKRELVVTQGQNADLQSILDKMNLSISRQYLWQRTPEIVIPTFVPPTQRKTRFLTILNYKGGVGKTTITANLAPSLIQFKPDAKVLLIDIDFQATLSRVTIEKAILDTKIQTRSYVQKLLNLEQYDPELVQILATPMNGVDRAMVILTDDTLDIVEFELQAKFFVDSEKDPRFCFRKYLHTDSIFNEYDYVIFDCPPRVTTSVVNAVLCSDYVLVPALLDSGSIASVGQAIQWVKGLGPLFAGQILGVVACQAGIRQKRLIKDDQLRYENLRGVVNIPEFGKNLVFRSVVADTPKARNVRPGLVASTTPTGLAVYRQFTEELLQRMGQL